jgi:repressor LexA
MPESLTDRQREIFNWIKAFIRKHRMPPTVREIGEAFDIKGSSVFQHLKAMEKKGHLRRGELGARSLIVRGRESIPCNCEKVPVIGRIAAGSPILAVEEETDTVTVEKKLLRGGEAYALRVEGNSMVGAGILDGDHVIVRRQDTADDGDIVVALIEDEATLKRFYRDGKRIRLEPANKRMKAIIVEAGEFRVQGKVIAVRRTL